MSQPIRHDIVVIGASSGGLETLLEILPQLPRDLAAAIFLVVHVPSQGKSQLPSILSRAGRLPAAHARDTEPIEMGRIYVAPPDFHLLLRNGQVRVIRGPRENNHRPAIDPLFRSAARVYGPRVTGVILSGMLDDGAAGLFAVKSRGGAAIVQDPDDALFSDMPRNAMAFVSVDYCLPKREIPKVILELTGNATPVERSVKMKPEDPSEMEKETEIEAMDEETLEDEDKPGNPSVYGCPDCGGVLWEMQDNGRLRFRCRVGHAFSADGLLRTQGESLESALWSAFRILHENAALSRRLAERARSNDHFPAAEKFERKSKIAEEHAELIRELLLSGQIKSADEAQAE
jgi:two-component system, chemotaxis family, protein-glutamate methylesterase/glutaminase